MPQCLTYPMHNAQTIDSEWLWQLNRIISTCRLNFTVWNSIILRDLLLFFSVCDWRTNYVRITIWIDRFNTKHLYVALHSTFAYIGIYRGHFYSKFNYNNAIGTWDLRFRIFFLRYRSNHRRKTTTKSMRNENWKKQKWKMHWENFAKNDNAVWNLMLANQLHVHVHINAERLILLPLTTRIGFHFSLCFFFRCCCS